MSDLFDLFDLGEAKRVRWRVGTAEAADTLLGLDGHVGELRRDAEGWWTVWRDGREQRGLGFHRTQLEAAKAVLDHDWSGVEARPTGEWEDMRRRIRQLSSEAGEAGDAAMVASCARALAGDAAALDDVIDALDMAEAARGGER